MGLQVGQSAGKGIVMVDILFQKCSVCHGWYVAPPEQNGPLICSECDHAEPEARPIHSVEIKPASGLWWMPASMIAPMIFPDEPMWSWSLFPTDDDADAAVDEAERIIRGESS